MITGKRHTEYFLLCLSGLVLMMTAGCEYESVEKERQLPPSAIVLGIESADGEYQRPAVEFDHALHVKARSGKGCGECHETDKDNKMVFSFTAAAATDDRDNIMDMYHARCIECHQKLEKEGAESGPSECGRCHIERPGAAVLRSPAKYDYSLHYRHVKAAKEDCGTCHHDKDEQTSELRYFKGEEKSCTYCHGEEDDGKKLSLENASHRACISCHLDNQEKNIETGPVSCEGCHDAAKIMSREKLTDPARISRNQPDKVWLYVPGAMSKMVPFNHELHETLTEFCSDCHHRDLKKCSECHTLTGKEDGQWITMKEAFHKADASSSCVGCHRKAAGRRECSGCHVSLPEPPSESLCMYCHSGPQFAEKPQTMPVPALPEVNSEALPDAGVDFPEKVIIDVIAKEYGPSDLPHGKIVRGLYKTISESRAARRFHGSTELMCTGCHHNTPQGTRPAPCRSCHAGQGDPEKDMPGLKHAYHRQCIGCHQAMQIKAQGCEDCHKKASSKEVSP